VVLLPGKFFAEIQLVGTLNKLCLVERWTQVLVAIIVFTLWFTDWDARLPLDVASLLAHPCACWH
jgi:hypothetical protein